MHNLLKNHNITHKTCGWKWLYARIRRMNRLFRSTFRRLAICVAALTGSATAAGASAAEPTPEAATTNEIRFVILPNGKTTVDGIPLFSREGADQLAAALSAATNAAATIIRAEAGDYATVDDLDAAKLAVCFSGLASDDPPLLETVDDSNIPFFLNGWRPVAEADALPLILPTLAIRLGTDNVLIGGFRFPREELGTGLERLPDALRRASNLADGGDHPPVACFCYDETPLSDLLAVCRAAAGLGFGSLRYGTADFHFHEAAKPSLTLRVLEKKDEWWKAAEDEP